MTQSPANLAAPGPRWPARLALGLALALAGLGLALLALGWIGFAAWRAWADRLAFHGTAEFFTPALHARLSLGLRAGGAGLVSAGVAA
ncbi:MAG: hypothetical protein V1797_16675, partial [Pseudomonadota bacterium]